jgi:hypothetical protein
MESEARHAWHEWGKSFGMFTTCCACRELRYCRGPRRGRLLCLPCWDLGVGRAR